MITSTSKTGIPKIAIFIFVLFISGITFILGIALGGAGSYLQEREGSEGTDFQLENTQNTETVTVNFDNYWEVWNYLQTDYVDPNIDQQKMLEESIKGMVDSLGDQATSYFTAEETQAYDQVSAGNFEGIGAELGYENGLVTVKNPLEGSPAKDSGLLSGDVILKVDDEEIADLTISEVVLKIRGEKGSKVILTIKRNGEGQKDFEITRNEIHVESIEIREFKDGIIYLRINRFTESNFEKFTGVWDNIVAEIISKNPDGIIIDMRGNPGGYLNGAVYMANDFLPEGSEILYVEDRAGDLQKFEAVRKPRLEGMKNVILVDENTASAAEIFTGALKHYKRTTVIGEKTVGKGTAQQIIKPEKWGGASLHLTVQKWLLPDKTWLNPDNPIVPDIEVSNSEEDIKNGNDSMKDKAWEVIQSEI